MVFKEIIVVYSENNMKFINTLCGQKAELLIVKKVKQSRYTPRRPLGEEKIVILDLGTRWGE
jgi:hypothetical protein